MSGHGCIFLLLLRSFSFFFLIRVSKLSRWLQPVRVRAVFKSRGWCSQKEGDPVPLVLLCECQGAKPSLRTQPSWVTASFLLWSPWEQESVFPSKLREALHHIKQRCRESACSAAGNLTKAELTAYKAVCRSLMDCGFLLGLVGWANRSQ